MPMFHSTPVVGPSSAMNGTSQPRMVDDHYDIPWEFKNRTLAAVVGQQLQQYKKRTKETVQVPKTRGDNSEMPSMDDHPQQQQQMVRKRLSLPQTMCNNALGKKLVGGNGVGKPSPRERKMAQGTVPANEQFQFIQQPTIATSFDSSSFPQMAALPWVAPAAALVPCPSSSLSSSTSSSSSSSTESVSAGIRRPFVPSSAPSNRQGAERVIHQPQQHPYNSSSKSPQHKVPAAEPRRPSENSQTSTTAVADSGQQLRNYPMVAMPSSATAKEVIAFCQRRQCPPALEKLDSLVHEMMDRCQAEQILAPMNLGAHLLRRRPDRNLALSLRAKEGVLHIKLEFHQSQWVLGDGPRFSSVHGMLRAYRRTELPVRGAEQIRLGVLLKPTDVSGGLLLL